MGKGEAKCRRRAGRGEGGEWGERRDTDGGVADGHGGHAGSGAGVVSSVVWRRGVLSAVVVDFTSPRENFKRDKYNFH